MSAPQNLENQVALVPCPKCGARANVGCFVPSGKLRANHAARRQLWRKKVELSKSPDDALIFAITQVTEINTRLTAELSTLKEQLRLTKEMLGAAKRIELDDGSVLRSRPIHGEILWAACNEHGAVVGNYFHVLEAYAAIKPVQNPVENNNP